MHLGRRNHEAVVSNTSPTAYNQFGKPSEGIRCIEHYAHINIITFFDCPVVKSSSHVALFEWLRRVVRRQPNLRHRLSATSRHSYFGFGGNSLDILFREDPRRDARHVTSGIRPIALFRTFYWMKLAGWSTRHERIANQRHWTLFSSSLFPYLSYQLGQYASKKDDAAGHVSSCPL